MVVPVKAQGENQMTVKEYEKAIPKLMRELEKHAKRMTFCREDAEDALSEALLKAMQNIDHIESRGLRPWLYRVVTNAAVDQHRHRRKRVLLSIHERALSETLDGSETWGDTLIDYNQKTEDQLVRVLDVEAAVESLTDVQRSSLSELSLSHRSRTFYRTRLKLNQIVGTI